jgi:tetratricopeptide (TPR) repeat protein
VTRSNACSRSGSRIAAAWLAAACLALAACQHVPQDRHETADPDVRLADALAQYDLAQSGGRDNGAVLSDESVISDSGAARLAIEQLTLEFPTHVPTLVTCADLALQAGEYEKAGAYADRALALQPENNFAAITRARTAIHDGNLVRARTVIESQVRLTPQSPYIHELLASVRFLEGDLDACEHELSQAERLGGDAPRLAYNRGLIAERKGDRAGAQKLYRRALELQPNYQEAQARLSGLTGTAQPK